MRFATTLLAVLALTLGSCVSVWQTRSTAPASLQSAATIKVTNTCRTAAGGLTQSVGSGVAISRTMALTAEHVIDCDGPEQVIIIERRDGTRSAAVVDSARPGFDIARIELVVDTFSAFVNRVAEPPSTDDLVCTMTAYPGWNRKCGWVEGTHEDRSMDIRHSVVSEPGNSGGGVYNEAGELVGIVTRVYFCSSLWDVGIRQACGGYFSSVWKARELVL